MASAAEYHGLAMACCHELDPTGLVPTFICVQVFESTIMMHLKLVGHMGGPTVFADLSQKPLFEF
jgi:hypothetical protein